MSILIKLNYLNLILMNPKKLLSQLAMELKMLRSSTSKSGHKCSNGNKVGSLIKRFTCSLVLKSLQVENQAS